MTHSTRSNRPARTLRRAAILAVAGLAFIAAACTGTDSPPPQAAVASPAPGSADAHTGHTDSHTISAYEQEPLVVNVEVTEDGFLPEVLFLPQGRRVQLVFRNRTNAEHHYHVMGLEIGNLLWVSTMDTAAYEAARNAAEGGHAGHGAPAEAVPETTLTDANDHEHHAGHLVDFHICTSISGICPTGDWVHAHSNPGEMDTIFFTPLSTGRFEVVNPLVKGMTATVVVH